MSSRCIMQNAFSTAVNHVTICVVSVLYHITVMPVSCCVTVKSDLCVSCHDVSDSSYCHVVSVSCYVAVKSVLCVSCHVVSDSSHCHVVSVSCYVAVKSVLCRCRVLSCQIHLTVTSCQCHVSVVVVS